MTAQSNTNSRVPARDGETPEDPFAPLIEADEEALETAELIRLNKFLAERGVASRRKCDELIAKGKVSVDGVPVSELGTKIDPTLQTVEIDGVLLKPELTRRRYYLLNKPKGVVCTNEPREARTRAIDLITDKNRGRIYTVGRLDEESEGLILLTNDGEFTNLIAHPRHGVPKTYKVRVRGRMEYEAIEKLRKGVRLSEGKTGEVIVRIEKRTQQYTTLWVTLREGKNREVRRMFAAVGSKVASLRRTRIGTITDRRLKLGEWRPLTRAEVKGLLELAQDVERSDALMRSAMRPSTKGGRAGQKSQRGGTGAGRKTAKRAKRGPR